MIDQRMSHSFAKLLLSAATLIAVPALAQAESFSLNVVTFNVLVEIANDKGVPAWKYRKGPSAQLLKNLDADLIGLQEPTPGQVDFFLKELPGYGVVKANNFTDATLLYKRDTVTLREQGHWWLSPTPDRVSIGFGNYMPRAIVWALLEHRASHRNLYVFNTHFDNTLPSQAKMAALCKEKMKPFLAKSLPIIFMGDFNTDQKRGDYSTLISGGWSDSYRANERASADGRDDNVSTVRDGQKRIDHIFYHGKNISVMKWERLESPDPNIPLSDHYPVRAILQFGD